MKNYSLFKKSTFVLFGLTGAFLLSYCSSSSENSPDGPQPSTSEIRSQVIDDIAANLIAPAYSELATQTQDLGQKIDLFCESFNEQTLNDLRTSWKEAHLAYRATIFYDFGQVDDLIYRGKIFYLPIEKAEIENLISEEGTDLTDEIFDREGGTVKGLMALEAILFSANETESPLSTWGENKPAYCQYLKVAHRSILDTANALADLWQKDSGPEFINFTQQQSNDYSSVHLCLSIILNRASQKLSDLRTMQIAAPLQELKVDHERDPTQIQARLSKEAVAAIRAEFEALQQFYAADYGFGRVVNDLSPNLHQKALDEFGIAQNLLDDLDSDFEEIMNEDPQSLIDVYQALQNLRVTFETIAPILGITLTFSDSDGD